MRRIIDPPPFRAPTPRAPIARPRLVVWRRLAVLAALAGMAGGLAGCVVVDEHRHHDHPPPYYYYGPYYGPHRY